MFVINLKDRTDKLDAIQLAASLTGFNLDVIEGVRGTEVSNKSMPPHGVPDVSVHDNSIMMLDRLTTTERKSIGMRRASTILSDVGARISILLKRK